MEDGKKYGVKVEDLEKLKEFQYSLLKNRWRTPLKMDYSKVIKIVQNEEEITARLSLGEGLLKIEYLNGTTQTFSQNEMVSISVICLTARIQFYPHPIMPYCLNIKFPNKEELEEFIAKLPQLPRPPVDELYTSNSSSESSSDSAQGVTHQHRASDSEGGVQDLMED